MAATPIVPNLDVLEYLLTCLLARGESAAMNQLALQGSEETFHHGVVPAVTTMAHAAHYPVCGQQVLVIYAGVLTASITMMEQVGCWFSAQERHPKSVQHERPFQCRLHIPAHNSAAEQIHLTPARKTDFPASLVIKIGVVPVFGCGSTRTGERRFVTSLLDQFSGSSASLVMR